MAPVNIDRVFQIIDVLMFAALIVQGEFIRYYEREVHRIQSEREAERRQWREQKRKQIVKKAEQKVPDENLENRGIKTQMK